MMNMKPLRHSMMNTSLSFRTLTQTLGLGLLVAGLLVTGVGCDSGNGGDSEPPPAPSTLNVTGNQEVELDWEAVDADDLAGYAVRRTAEGSDAVASLTPVDSLFTSTSHTDTDLRDGATYTYWVVAIDEAGNESERSPEKQTTVFATPPENPDS